MIIDKLDLMRIGKGKPDNSFDTAKFLFKVYLVQFWLSQKMNTGGILALVTEIIQAGFLNDHGGCNYSGVFVCKQE